jgi:uncharacterized protein DUF992
MVKKSSLAIGAAVLAATAYLAVPAEAAGIKVGVLTCNVQGGWGFILGSSKAVNCSFVGQRGYAEHYVGNISKVGVDIGYTKGGVLIWDVIAPESNMRPGALQGDYGGLTASATVGAGIGANALIGGFDRSFTLQPVSIEGNTGLNVAAGIGALDLKFERG